MNELRGFDYTKKYLVTGAAGFIGFHLSKSLLDQGSQVVGYDNINDYYDTSLKQARLNILLKCDKFKFYKADISDKSALEALFLEDKPQIVIHLAAQAGVRYSLENPDAYVQSNLVGFVNILEMCRNYRIEHFVYASSSSVYGANKKLPFSVNDRVDSPVSLYAATKKSNELIAHTYSHLFGIPTTGLRFFTVYGPYGRPDMAAFLFLDAIFKDNPIRVYNNGEMRRDFTYIDDIVRGIILTVGNSSALRQKLWNVPYCIYNIGNNKPESIIDFIGYLEEFSGRKAVKQFLPLQPGDIPETYADIDGLLCDIGFKPETNLRDGLEKFVEWYREYYQ